MDNDNQVVGLTVEELQERRKILKELVEAAESLDRLHNNADFKKVFVEGYFEKEAIRLVHLLGDVTTNSSPDSDKRRQDLQERMIGIARASEYLRFISYKRAQAEKELQGLAEAEAEHYGMTRS